MKKIFSTFVALLAAANMMAQGWPSNYGGVMLQSFYWDSYNDTQWTNLTTQADELSKYFKLVWVPQSGWCNGMTQMGYADIYWLDQHRVSQHGSTSLTRHTQVRRPVRPIPLAGPTLWQTYAPVMTAARPKMQAITYLVLLTLVMTLTVPATSTIPIAKFRTISRHILTFSSTRWDTQASVMI